jgi:hypothetical protein
LGEKKIISGILIPSGDFKVSVNVIIFVIECIKKMHNYSFENPLLYSLAYNKKVIGKEVSYKAAFHSS